MRCWIRLCIASSHACSVAQWRGRFRPSQSVIRFHGIVYLATFFHACLTVSVRDRRRLVHLLPSGLYSLVPPCTPITHCSVAMSPIICRVVHDRNVKLNTVILRPTNGPSNYRRRRPDIHGPNGVLLQTYNFHIAIILQIYLGSIITLIFAEK